MCGLYSCNSERMSYRFSLYVCHDVWLCTALPFNYILGVGDVKGVLCNSSTKPRVSLVYFIY